MAEDEETIYSNIRQYVSKFNRIKQILDSDIIRIAGEEVPLPNDVKTVLETKKAEVKALFQAEVKKLLVE
jgi:hypothetical protein